MRMSRLLLRRVPVVWNCGDGDLELQSRDKALAVGVDWSCCLRPSRQLGRGVQLNQAAGRLHIRRRLSVPTTLPGWRSMLASILRPSEPAS